MMMREQHRLAKQTSSKVESWQYKALMALPRNLVYVFLCVIVFAFLGMIYVVYSERDLSSFMNYTQYREEIVAHPMFQHWRNFVIEEYEIPLRSINNMTSQIFYKDYLTKNIPLYLFDGCKQAPAIEKWSDKKYLEQEFGGQSILIIRLDRPNTTAEFQEYSIYQRRNNFKEFLNKTENGTHDGKFMYFIKNEMLVSKNLQNDYNKPFFLSKLLRNRLIGLTIWQPFRRSPEFKDRERYVCVIDGIEEFRMVSPLYKQNIYSGVFEELVPKETPVDFFEPNYNEFPLLKQANIMKVQVEQGGCIYIPAYYWLQTKTKSEEATLITFEYEAHSELVSLLFQAIDQGILED